MSKQKQVLKFSDLLLHVEDVIKIGSAIDNGKQKGKVLKWPVYFITSEFKIGVSHYKSQDFERAFSLKSAKRKARLNIIAEMIGKV